MIFGNYVVSSLFEQIGLIIFTIGAQVAALSWQGFCIYTGKSLAQ